MDGLKILFLHGLASSGCYKTAGQLRTIFEGSTIIAPDIPFEPLQAKPFIENLCLQHQPDLIVGISLGGFWAQMMHGYKRILINPDLSPAAFLRSRIGTMQYLSPRQDGSTSFEITEEACRIFEQLSSSEILFPASDTCQCAALFCMDDELIPSYYNIFEAHYPGYSICTTGGHLPAFPVIKAHLPQLSQKLGISK